MCNADNVKKCSEENETKKVQNIMTSRSVATVSPLLSLSIKTTPGSKGFYPFPGLKAYR